MGKDKEAYYFSHDSNARNDPSIVAMRCVYGAEGYGWYWMIVEMLREQSDYKLGIQSKYAYRAFALQLQCETDMAEKFISDCIDEFMLFESDGSFFWSKSLIRRMTKMEEKSKKARKSAEKRWGKASDDVNEMRTHTERNANEMQTQCDGNALKEKKVNEMKLKESSSNEIDSAAAYSPSISDVHTKVFKTFSMNGLMTDYVRQLLQRGFDESFITEVMLETGESSANPNIKLMKTIAERWEKDGIKTREEAKQKKNSEQVRPRIQRTDEKNKELLNRRMEAIKNDRGTNGEDASSYFNSLPEFHSDRGKG